MFIDKNRQVNGYKIWDYGYGSFAPLKPVCRKLAAESAVLLKNENNTLPLSRNESVAVFGRMQLHYYKSGNGSGGNVRAPYVPTFIEAFEKETILSLDEEVLNVYKNWVEEHPFDNGTGWAKEPFCQEEMPLDDDIVSSAAKRNQTAIIIIGRTSGEDKDNLNEKGSFLLTDVEEDMLQKVCEAFRRVVVLLNVGNIIDISFLNRYNISSLMYVWQGGMEGANAVADLLVGRISPSGKLADTQAYSCEDYPSSEDFGSKEVFYKDDIFVGYRYFETFSKEKVMYPFGFGLSYTKFDISYEVEQKDGNINICANVHNVGNMSGKEVVQIYYAAPQGKLGNPVKQLVTFAKTKTLQPGESEVLKLSFKITDMASYDDSGITGNSYCYVMEQGEYTVFAGTDVRTCEPIFSYINNNTVVTEKLTQAMAPTKDFERYCAELNENGEIVKVLKPVPQITYDVDERSFADRPEDIPYTGDLGIKLIDVADGKNTMEEFIAQFSLSDLCQIVCGEGMSSPKTKRVGTGAVMGGVTGSLANFGLPIVCLCDGPAGIRFVGEATSFPIGTALACTWNTKEMEELATLLGIELFANDIDILLGGGMNIHRNPLNGRNFEYFSEDPIVSGKMAAALTRGISKSGVATTIKHFAANSQEKFRHSVDAIISERALREIYLKGFEIAVKEGNVSTVMTSYNRVNGSWSASNYDLTTTLLRKEWGFKGFVMTDWWATCNWKLSANSNENLKSMIKAQNDIYMVCPDATARPHDIVEGIESGFITLGDLQRCAMRIVYHCMSTPAFLKFVDGGCKKPSFTDNDDANMQITETFEQIKKDNKYSIDVDVDTAKICLVFELSCSADTLAQLPIQVFDNGCSIMTVIINGTNGETVTEKRFMTLKKGEHNLSFDFGDSILIKKVTVKR